jgi:hypothetical protein
VSFLDGVSQENDASSSDVDDLRSATRLTNSGAIPGGQRGCTDSTSRQDVTTLIRGKRGRKPAHHWWRRKSRRMSDLLLAEAERAEATLQSCPTESKERIYVLVQRDGSGYVKIGTTINLTNRLGDHQGNAYGELKLLAAFHGGKSLESSLHLRFDDDLVYGHREHFWPSRSLLSWIDDVRRLNGRDGGLCWSCRQHALEHEPWSIAGQFVPNGLDFETERVDMRCGDRCEPICAWFDRETRQIAAGRDSTGFNSDTPSEFAGLLFRDDARDWAIRTFWARSMGRGADLALIRFAHQVRDGEIRTPAVERIPTEPYEMHHAARQTFPDCESFPEPRR